MEKIQSKIFDGEGAFTAPKASESRHISFEKMSQKQRTYTEPVVWQEDEHNMPLLATKKPAAEGGWSGLPMNKYLMNGGFLPLLEVAPSCF